MSAILIGYSKCPDIVHLKGFYCQLISLAIHYITFLLHLKFFCYSAILLATLQCNYRNKAMLLGINFTSIIETNVWQTKSLCDYTKKLYKKFFYKRSRCSNRTVTHINNTEIFHESISIIIYREMCD